MSAPQAQAQSKGAFNVSAGLGYASNITTYSNGSQTTNGTDFGFVFNADYRYPIAKKFSVGPALQYWSLGGSSKTSVAALASYALNPSSEVYFALGNGGRVGYSQAFGKKRDSSKGAFYVAEYVFPNDNRVDSFGYLGIGYKF